MKEQPPYTFCATCHRVIYVRDVDAANNCADCAAVLPPVGAPPITAFPNRTKERDE